MWQTNNTIQHDNMTIQHHNNMTIQHDRTIWQYDNISIQQHNNMTIQHNRTIWQFDNITRQQHNNMIIHHALSYYYVTICTYIHVHQNFYDKSWKSPQSCKDWQHLVLQWSWNESHMQKSEMSVVFAWWTYKEFCQMSTTCNYLEDGIWIADDVRVVESSISMGVTISIIYVTLSGLGKISIIWRPLFSRFDSLWMLSTLNTFKWMGIPFLLIVNLPPSSPPRLGCGIVILLQLSISWHHIILVYPLNQLSLFAVEVQPHSSSYSWWLFA